VIGRGVRLHRSYRTYTTYVVVAACLCSVAWSAPFAVRTSEVPWQQVERARTFWVFVEREELSALDRVSRMVFAVQNGAKGPKLDSLRVHWTVTHAGRAIAENTASMAKGLVDVGFRVDGLAPGRYEVAAELMQGDKTLEKRATFFRIVKASKPKQSGRIALNLPRGVPLKRGTFPITSGVPFPKGALWSKDHVRVVTADGKTVPVQTIVRSRWGHTPETSIRWLGVDFQAAGARAWWPERKDTQYFLEFGPRVRRTTPAAALSVKETPEGVEVDTGALQFLVRRKGFNLLDNVRLNGKSVMQATPKDGLYLVEWP